MRNKTIDVVTVEKQRACVRSDKITHIIETSEFGDHITVYLEGGKEIEVRGDYDDLIEKWENYLFYYENKGVVKDLDETEEVA